MASIMPKNIDIKKIKMRTVEPQVWKYENEGDQIAGILVRVKPRTEDKSSQYFLQVDQQEYMIWGSALLDERMQAVEIGEFVMITYKGKKQIPNTTKSLHIFEVMAGNPSPAE